jgi:hypothetical protein
MDKKNYATDILNLPQLVIVQAVGQTKGAIDI